MFILEGPYASGIMLDWLEESQHPVLDTEFARLQVEGGRILNLVKSAQAAERIDDGERLYTCSESALEWVLANGHEQNLLRYIRLCKDKAETRRALAANDPRHFFRECTMDELVAIEKDNGVLFDPCEELDGVEKPEYTVSIGFNRNRLVLK